MVNTRKKRKIGVYEVKNTFKLFFLFLLFFVIFVHFARLFVVIAPGQIRHHSSLFYIIKFCSTINGTYKCMHRSQTYLFILHFFYI